MAGLTAGKEEAMMLSITWGAVVKICVVIAFAGLIRTFIGCMHDSFCKTCK